MSVEPIYFCGCLHDEGHFTYTPGELRRSLSAPAGCPWPGVDSSKFAPKDTRQNVAAIWRKGGWTLLRISDYTIDSRGGSHSSFFGHVDPDLWAFVAMAEAAWPTVMARLKACGPIVIEFQDAAL